MKSRLNYILCSLILSISLMANGNAGSLNTEITKRFNIETDSKGELLINLLEEISNKTGYSFELSQDTASILVRGNFIDVSIEEFYQRVFRGENVIIDINEAEQIVAVRLFKQSKFISSSDQGKSGNNLAQTDEEIKAVYEQQKTELMLMKNDAFAIDPESGIPQGELKSIHEEQMALYQEFKDDLNAIDPETGVSHGDLEQLHAEQMEQYSNESKDEDKIDHETGVKQKDLKLLHAEQMAEYNKMKNDDSAIDPETGVSYGELRRLHAKQSAKLL